MADKEKLESEEEYESDLDDAPLSALRRRDAASDDEDEDEDGGMPLRRRKAGSDADSDGQGAAEVYDEDGAYEESEEYEEYEYGGFKAGGGGVRGVAVEAVAGAGHEEGEAGDGEAEKAGEAAPGGEEEDKKGNEPYSVPTTGAFYMHDDRFQEGRGRGRGRQRRMVNSRRLWSPKDEQAWVHDRFDEMDLHDFHGDNPKRKQGGVFRGRGGGQGGRTRGISRGNFRGSRTRTYYHDGSKNYSYVPKESHAYRDNTKNAHHSSHINGKNRVPKPSRDHYDGAKSYDIVPNESHIYHGDAKSQKNAPRVVRGRGSKRYQPRLKSTSDVSSVQNTKSQSLEGTSSNANLVKDEAQGPNSRLEQVLPIKQTVASNLNSASPPFYPARSSSQEFAVGQGENTQELSTNLVRGKAFVPSGHVEAAINGMNRPALLPPASSSNGPFPVATNQVNRDYGHPAHPIVQQNPVQPPTRSAPRMPAQMFGATFSNGSKISPAQPTSTILDDDAEISSPSGSNKYDSRLTVKGQPDDQGEERASFLYGGARVLGATSAMGITLGDQNFHGTPALLPGLYHGSVKHEFNNMLCEAYQRNKLL
ncbi:protein MLN51 homolog isoform X2 [Zea mays]|uniref:Btz domain-containing protein n=2 Tax=Zea mays TaxID=4577 RepID=A0A804QQV5_MAIZE|nr:protein MLN51 homolog isoform X2 [Zea mays]|eukprot:XP_008656485.1 protein MLN51 homolog isoform X2 [Zea mays]